VPPGDGFHWTGPYKNWDGRCAECHATGYVRHYQPASDRFAPVMAEIGLGCEGCHGQGEAHVGWAIDPHLSSLAAELTPDRLTVDLGASQQAEVMGCLTCHSRRQAMGDGKPVPGTDYLDSFFISPLRAGLYHPDGTILDEVFEGGSFLQSRMFAMGVRCSDCHDPHASALVAESNAMCTQCHPPAGRPEFPSFPLQVFDEPEHHFHPDGSTDAQCVPCHMIERTYMGVDERRDHSFRVPRPDRAATGAPDACADCPTDRDAAWAAAELAARFPDSRDQGTHFATVRAAVRLSPQLQVADLLAIAEVTDRAAIVRATALDLLGPVADVTHDARVRDLTADPDPLVRGAAAGALRGLAPDARLAVLRPLLANPLRAMREAAVRALLDAASLPEAAADPAYAAARAEWQEALALRADFPETHLQIGGTALTLRDFDLALAAFRPSVTLDPQMVDAWSMVVRIRAAMGEMQGPLAALDAGLAANPGNPDLLALMS